MKFYKFKPNESVEPNPTFSVFLLAIYLKYKHVKIVEESSLITAESIELHVGVLHIMV